MWRRSGFIIVTIALLAGIARNALEATQVRHTVFYVSTSGSDQNSGILEAPWRSLQHALGQLSAGDVLYLREGTYYEHEITIDKGGTGSAPIVIQSYPGERAVIDGGVPYFKNRASSEWELVDDTIGLYRSIRAFPVNSGFVRAWLVDDDIQLVEYDAAENMTSTNYGPLDGLAPLYMGPGVQIREDGHIYIRLAYNPNDLTDVYGTPIEPTPKDTDPNNNRIAVFFSRYIFRLKGASYLHFRDIDFSHADYIFDARDGSHHIMLSGCRLNFGHFGLVLREGAQDWGIFACEFNNGLPDYVYWTDVKNREFEVVEAYPEFQSAAISGALSGFTIYGNLFRNTFDAVTVREGSAGTRIVNNIFRKIGDDSINLSTGIRNIEVAHNMMWQVKSGISNLGSSEPPGHVYIHHNVIDNSAHQRGGRPGNYRQDNWPAWTTGNPFPDHDDGNKVSWWKLYNNTVVTSKNVGHPWAAAGPDSVTGNPEKYVYNNIFYVLDERVIFRNDLTSYGSHYDGNLVYRVTPAELPLFSDFGDGGRYDSLQEFHENASTDWEVNGLEVDPGFDVAAITDPNFDRETIWQRYEPGNDEVFTPGAPYDGFDWPEVDGVSYRGAIPPP